MDESLKQQILLLYPEYNSVLGPYTRKQDGRKIAILHSSKEQRTTRQFAKVLLEVKIGRRLIGDETVDHKDDDYLNDDPDNLQLLSKSVNSSKSVLRAIPETVKCINCETEFTPSKGQINKRAQTKAGPFCSKSCSGLYGTYIQNGGNKVGRVPIKVEYKKLEGGNGT